MSLFGHLALRFGSQPENLATEALSYILGKSMSARLGFLGSFRQDGIEHLSDLDLGKLKLDLMPPEHGTVRPANNGRVYRHVRVSNTRRQHPAHNVRVFVREVVVFDNGKKKRITDTHLPLDYTLWERRGRPTGDDCADWYEAERRMRVSEREQYAANAHAPPHVRPSHRPPNLRPPSVPSQRPPTL